jgi:hypothetical protein
MGAVYRVLPSLAAHTQTLAILQLIHATKSVASARLNGASCKPLPWLRLDIGTDLKPLMKKCPLSYTKMTLMQMAKSRAKSWMLCALRLQMIVHKLMIRVP